MLMTRLSDGCRRLVKVGRCRTRSRRARTRSGCELALAQRWVVCERRGVLRGGLSDDKEERCPFQLKEEEVVVNSIDKGRACEAVSTRLCPLFWVTAQALDAGAGAEVVTSAGLEVCAVL